MLLLLFAADSFAQTASVYGSSSVTAGQTYTYEASVTLPKYFWGISGGTIVGGHPMTSKTISVVWDYSIGLGTVSFGDMNYSASKNVSISNPSPASCVSHYRNNLGQIVYTNTCPYPVCFAEYVKYPGESEARVQMVLVPANGIKISGTNITVFDPSIPGNIIVSADWYSVDGVVWCN